MERLYFIFSISLLMLMSGCVSTKKFNSMKASAQLRFDSVSGSNRDLQSKLASCNNNLETTANEKKSIQQELDNKKKEAAVYKQNNTTMLKQLEDFSVVTSKQAESI